LRAEEGEGGPEVKRSSNDIPDDTDGIEEKAEVTEE
jgi:hypothetical protein